MTAPGGAPVVGVPVTLSASWGRLGGLRRLLRPVRRERHAAHRGRRHRARHARRADLRGPRGRPAGRGRARAERPRPRGADPARRLRSAHDPRRGVPVRGQRRLPRRRRHLLPRLPPAPARPRQLPGRARRRGRRSTPRSSRTSTSSPTTGRPTPPSSPPARLLVHFRDWLGAWLQTHIDLADTDDLLAATSPSPRNFDDPNDTLIRIHQRVGEFVSVQQGVVGQIVGQKVAEAKLGGFLESGAIDGLPDDSKQALFPAVDTSSGDGRRARGAGARRDRADAPDRAVARRQADRERAGARRVSRPRCRTCRPSSTRSSTSPTSSTQLAQRARLHLVRDLVPHVHPADPHHLPADRPARPVKTELVHWAVDHEKAPSHAIATYDVTTRGRGAAHRLPRVVRLRLRAALAREHRRRSTRLRRGSAATSSRSTAALRRPRSRTGQPGDRHARHRARGAPGRR